MRPSVTCIAVALTFACPCVVRAQDSTLERALRDEMTRSIKELELGQLARPYFIAYRASDLSGLSVGAMNGSLLESDEFHSRMFAPEVRVGDYAFDNTNFMNFGGGMIAIGSGSLEMVSFRGNLPLDDNYLELRRQIWLATDAEYKEAAENFAAKRAALLNRAGRDSLPDFSHAPPTQAIDTLPAAIVDRSSAEALVRGLSALPELAKLDRSSVRLSVGNTRTLLINTEGTRTLTGRPLITITASASTQASDGAPLDATLHVYARSQAALPARNQLTTAVRSLALRLDSLRTAPVLDRYSGPVLVDGRAAAELFAQVFAPALAGRRVPATGQPEFAAMMESNGRGPSSFTDRIGSRVLPTFLSVVDDPTVSDHGGEPLFGGYRVDDDGVPAQRKVLVQNGVVERVLTTRKPVKGALQSTGNRRGDGAAPSNLLVSSTNAVSEAELKARLLALVKQRGLEYGIIVRELASAGMSRDDPSSFVMAMGSRRGGRRVLLAYRVYADGREELVRGAVLTDLSAQSFKDVAAVSNTESIYHRAAFASDNLPIPAEMLEEMGDMGGPSVPLASYVVPSLLFEDLSLEHPAGEQPKPPLSPPPRSSR